MNRREFVIGSTAALVIAAAGGSYVFSSCPLDTERGGICTGPCTAFIDLDGDSFCDRLPPPLSMVQASQPNPAGDAIQVVQRACPFLNDPYPGECRHYVDHNGNNICDLSEPELVASGAVSVPSTDTSKNTGDGQRNQGSGQQRQRGKNN